MSILLFASILLLGLRSLLWKEEAEPTTTRRYTSHTEGLVSLGSVEVSRREKRKPTKKYNRKKGEKKRIYCKCTGTRGWGGEGWGVVGDLTKQSLRLCQSRKLTTKTEAL